MARQSRGEWLVYTDSATRGGNRNIFAYTRGAKSAIAKAEGMVVDHGAAEAIVSHEGRQAGKFTGAFWVQVTDPTLERALAKRAE